MKKLFEKFGYENVKTLLASGNILFDAPKSSPVALSGKITSELKKAVGYEIGVIVRSIKDIKELVDSNPFKGIKVTPETRLYVTFLAGKPTSKLAVPYASADGNFEILRVSDTEIISILTVTPTRSSVDLMNIIEKEYGKKVTTRNWNTILKTLK